jgi:hypothetical protein
MPNVPLPSTLAFGLGTSAFFWAGVGLVSVPIIIHILNRQRFRIVTWAAMEFLLRAMRKNRKRLKLEQWILLATRCLAVLLIGLALADPEFGCSNASIAQNLAGQTGMNVFIIDNSYSTAYKAAHSTLKDRQGRPLPTAMSHLDQQKQMAKLLIDAFGRRGKTIAIITAAKPEVADAGGPGAGGKEKVVRRVVLRPEDDPAIAKQFIDNIEQSYTGTDLAGALQLANDFADEKPKATGRNLYIFSDGTRSAWEGSQAEALKRVGPELAKRYKITHFNMAENRAQWNHIVADLRPGEALLTTKFEGSLLPTVRGYGTGPDPSFQLFMGGGDASGAEWRVGPARSVHPEPSSGPLSPPETLRPDQLKVGGPTLFTAALNPDVKAVGDPLPVDDKRYRVVDVAADVKVLIVQGQVSDKFGKSSGSFLKSALAPDEDESGVLSAVPRSKTHVTATLATEAELRDRPLRGYHAVVLCGVERMDEKSADALAAFVRDGGALMTFVGKGLQTENYNSVMLSRGLIPGRVLNQEDRRGLKQAYALDFDTKATAQVHRYLQLFKGIQNTGLDTARINTFWKVDVSQNPNVERVLNYRPGPVDPGTAAPADTAAAAARPIDKSSPPAITSHPLGQGTVIFFSTSASPVIDEDWQELVAHGGTWVQLLHEVLGGAISGRDWWMNLQAGRPLTIPSYIETSTPKLRDQNKQALIVHIVTEPGKQPVYRTDPLKKPGVYTLELKPNVLVPIAVNVPPEEADVRTVGNEFIRHALGDIQLTMRGDELSLQEIVEASKDNEWMVAVLLILLALLGVECFMAMWFGHYRKSAGATGGGPRPSTPEPAAAASAGPGEPVFT